jgi:hypothetical protein
MSSSLNPEELAELKAHHLACSHLIRGCQDATIRLRGGKSGGPDIEAQADVEFRAVEILEHILASWCETLFILRANLNGSPAGDLPFRQNPAGGPGIFSGEMPGRAAHVARSPSV